MSLINPMITVRPVLTPAQAALPSEGRSYGLQAGQLVNATVAEGGIGEVLLDLERQHLRAQTQTPLQTGQKLRLMVVESAPQLVLRTVHPSHLLTRLSHSVHLLEDRFDLASALALLTTALPAAPGGSPQQNLARLMDFFRPFLAASDCLPLSQTTPVEIPPPLHRAGESFPQGLQPGKEGPVQTEVPGRAVKSPNAAHPQTSPTDPAPRGMHPSEPTDTLRHRAEGADRPLPVFLEQVASRLPPLPVPVDSPFAGIRPGNQLQQLARHLGLTLEADLARNPQAAEPANLKSLLLTLGRAEDRGDPEQSRLIDSLLQKLELFQLCNLRLSRQDAFLLPLPLPFLDSGYLIAEKEAGAAAESPQARKITLYLTLQGLGELRIDMLQEDEGLFLRFTCDSRNKLCFLQEQEDELRKMLTALTLRGASYGSDSARPGSALVRRILNDSDELLDARI